MIKLCWHLSDRQPALPNHASDPDANLAANIYFDKVLMSKILTTPLIFAFDISDDTVTRPTQKHDFDPDSLLFHLRCPVRYDYWCRSETDGVTNFTSDGCIVAEKYLGQKLREGSLYCLKLLLKFLLKYLLKFLLKYMLKLK